MFIFINVKACPRGIPHYKIGTDIRNMLICLDKVRFGVSLENHDDAGQVCRLNTEASSKGEGGECTDDNS